MGSVHGVAAVLLAALSALPAGTLAQTATPAAAPAAGWYSVTGVLAQETCNGKDVTPAPAAMITGQLFFPGAGGEGMALYQAFVNTGPVLILGGTRAGETVVTFSRVSTDPLTSWSGSETLNSYGIYTATLPAIPKTTFSASIQPFDARSFGLQLIEKTVSTLIAIGGPPKIERCTAVKQFTAIMSGKGA